MTVEWNHIPEGEPALTRLMENNNYQKFRMISLNYSREVIYVHESVVVRKWKKVKYTPAHTEWRKQYAWERKSRQYLAG
jgi:hypothetical protein